ncbi:hypothetical protein [uncultured Cyclobacterium sp.]|uniref:hypothetical protein n=1 Tax=uncultured Cyclobacterium sp. TaxID=453820 RepID=UPI0030EE0663
MPIYLIKNYKIGYDGSCLFYDNTFVKHKDAFMFYSLFENDWPKIANFDLLYSILTSNLEVIIRGRIAPYAF